MFSIEISRALARTIFLHRATELPDGSMAFRLADDSGHVRVSKEQWEAAGQDFKAKTGKVKRASTIALWLWMPGYVLYTMIAGAIIPHALFKALPYWLQMTIFVGPLFATPFVVVGYWTYRVIQISKDVDLTLTAFGRPAILPSKPHRPPFWLDILCLFFVGPSLIVDVYGQLNPNAFHNTPWRNRHVDSVAIAGFALIAIRLIWGRVARRKNHAPQASL